MIDASVIVQASSTSRSLGPLAGHTLAAPSLLWSEAASALRQQLWRGEITSEQASDALEWLPRIEVEAHDSRVLLSEAWRIADRLGWAKTYDAEYVALARRLGVRLVTLDARLRRAVSGLVEVVGPTEV